MADIKDIISNIEQIYGSTSTLGILKDFERVLEELDLYVFDNWLDGELVAGPKDSKYFVECTFMWPQDQMPEPKGGLKLQEYGCKVQFAESIVTKVRKIRKPDDIRPGTKKGKIDVEPVWFVKIRMPKKLITDIGNGYNNIELEKMGQSAEQQLALNSVELADQQAQEIGNEEQIA
jgi:hypothetical protein